jgi:AcrR family transcriptional regulator
MGDVGGVDRRVERGRSTRQQLVAAATELFAAHGYERTSIESVLERTGASRGSLYHHFASKQALFEAVVNDLEARVGESIVAAAAAAGGTDPATALEAGSLAWVRLAGEPVVRRVLLIDAPAVLGWRRWRELEEQYGLGMIKAALLATAEQGRLPPELVEPLSHVVLAAMDELALVIALADDVARAQASAEAAVAEFFARLLPPVSRVRTTRPGR